MIRNIKTYRYDDEALLGEGGFARVFLAKGEGEENEAALKILKEEFEEDERVVGSFFRDPQVMKTLDHPNIIRILDVGAPAEKPFYLSMEYCAGGDLRAMIQRTQKLPIGQTLCYASTLSEALSYCHRSNILHRDIKASNILFRDEQTPLLSDFGSESPGEGSGENGAPYVGSPPYLSPEVWEKNPYDEKSDLYSFGVLLYYALTGRLPFLAEEVEEYRRFHLSQVPLPPSTWNPSISNELDSVVLALLEKDPRNRIPNADELRTTLDGIYRNSYADPQQHLTKLVLFGPRTKKAGIDVSQFPYRIGKSEERGGDQSNDYAVGHHDPYVSRYHAVIDKIDDSFVFTDISTNGCTVNGERIHRQSVELRKENRVTLGSKTKLVLRVVSDTGVSEREGETRTSILTGLAGGTPVWGMMKLLVGGLILALLMAIITLTHLSCL